jgi:hypothetical protein
MNANESDGRQILYISPRIRSFRTVQSLSDYLSIKVQSAVVNDTHLVWHARASRWLRSWTRSDKLGAIIAAGTIMIAIVTFIVFM